MKTQPKTKLIFKNINIPVVEFKLHDGVKGRGIIDTGSESTMLDMQFYKDHREGFKLDITDEKIEFKGFYGAESKRVIRASSYLYFKKHMAVMKDAVVCPLKTINKSLEDMYGEDMHIDIVFGSDFFAKNKIEINYKTKQMIFNE